MAKEPDNQTRLEKENSELRDRLTNIEKLLALQHPVITPIAREMAREEEFERKRAELSLTCKERTQLIARRLWSNPETRTEYPVRVAYIPEIMVPARSWEEAKGRYNELCGINGVDGDLKYQIGEPVSVANAA